MRATRPTSEGERLFAAYLRQRRIPWSFEIPVGDRNPDFTVHHDAGDVVCEIYEPEIRLPTTTSSFSSYPQLRSMFTKRKRKQAKAASGLGRPFVYVLGRANSDISRDPAIVAGAMLGDVGVSFPVFPDGNEPPGFDPSEHSRNILGRNRRLQPGMNTSVSAVAILRSFNPTLWRLEEADRARFGDLDRPTNMLDAYRRAQAREAIGNALHATGALDYDAALARVIVLHNPFAANPLGVGVFDGPHDEQWASIELIAGELAFTSVAQGRLSWEVPGVLGGREA